eukprot:3661380-Rhodomonas_salina.2
MALRMRCAVFSTDIVYPATRPPSENPYPVSTCLRARYAQSGTDVGAYGDVSLGTRYGIAGTERAHAATRTRCMRFAKRSSRTCCTCFRYAPTPAVRCARGSCILPMSGTDIAHASSVHRTPLLSCYTVWGNDAAYGATRMTQETSVQKLPPASAPLTRGAQGQDPSQGQAGRDGMESEGG